jgi:hypothetical protein
MNETKVCFLIQRQCQDGTWIYIDNGWSMNVRLLTFSSVATARRGIRKDRKVNHYRPEIPYRVIKRSTTAEVVK